MKTVGYIYKLAGLAAVLLPVACSDGFPDLAPGRAADEILVAGIAGSDGAGTRVVQSYIDDYWSYTRFSDPSDVIGFYSLYGNLDDASGNGPFYNAPMAFTRGEEGREDRYWRGVFRPLDMNCDVTLIKNDARSTFVYFPYSERMEEEGLELRRMVDGIYRCVDALAISKIADDNEAVMSGSFNHTFSEIILIRGYGFDKPTPDDHITVVTTEPYSHAKVVDNTNDPTVHPEWKILKPVYNASYRLSEQECREWKAWDGAPADGLPAKYVIIPTAISGDRSTVNYVELYDNNGTLHRVTTFGLMNADSKRVSPSERYWLTIKLEGLEPTIYPFAITPWEEAASYTEQRARGINTAEEFLSFVTAYNTYNERGRGIGYEEGLKNFGDRYEVSENGNVDVRWHFHINNDFDLSTLTVSNLNIPVLCDTLDGRTNTLSGIRANKAFITELQHQGCIRNLDITGLNVTGSTDLTGGLVNRMTGGLITGCSVDGFVNAGGAAGLAVGQFDAGTISNCSFSGLVVGASSYGEKKGLIGIGPDELLPEMIKNVNTSGLLFTSTGN